MKKTAKMLGAVILCTAMMFGLTACSDSAGENNSLSDNTPAPKEFPNGNKVYFAGPLFNQAEKDFNLKLTQVLEAYGYQVFLPQRDGIEAAQLEGKTEEELIEMIFRLDADEVLNADILFMNLDGRVPDEGACVELGIAYANQKRCYGFKTDTRAVESGLDLNPMISGCMIRLFKNYDGNQLIEEIAAYLSENDL